MTNPFHKYFKHTNLTYTDDRRSIIFIIVSSLIISLIFIATKGSIFSAAAVIILGTVIAITIYRLDYGFMLFIGAVLLFDQFPPRGYGITIIGVEYFQNLKSLDMFSGFDMAVINPLELQFLFIFTIWVLMIVIGKAVYLARIPVWHTAILFFFWLIVSAVYGIAKGGDFLPALWELRALFYMGVMYFFVPQMIQSREQLKKLIWVCIGTISFKAVQGFIRLVRMGFSFGYRNELTNHEDPLFFASLFILLFALFIFHSNNTQQKVLKWLAFLMGMIFILAQRRATYGAFGFMLVTFFILLPKKERWSLTKGLMPFGIIFIVYLVIFWNSDSTIAYPAQLIKSSFSTEQETAGERYESNLYRKFENYNLAQTVKKSPIIGIGFGNKYDQPIILANIPFPLRDYIPHNEIFWLIVKMGGIGFFLFWFFMDAFILQATYVFYRLKDPYLKSICTIAIVAVVGQIVVSFFDLQLTYYRNMVYLGLLMGLLPTIESIDKETPSDSEISAQQNLELVNKSK